MIVTCIHNTQELLKLKTSNVLGDHDVFSAQAGNQSHNEPAVWNKHMKILCGQLKLTCSVYTKNLYCFYNGLILRTAGNRGWERDYHSIYLALPIERDEEGDQVNANLDKGFFLEAPQGSSVSDLCGIIDTNAANGKRHISAEK